MIVKKSQIYINLVALLFSGTACYFIFSSSSVGNAGNHLAPPVQPIPEHLDYHSLRGTDFRFVKPQLYLGRDFTTGTYTALKSTLQRFISGSKSSGAITSSSVFLRDLTSGDWMSCNPEQKFVFGNARLPLLLSYLHQAQTVPALLDKKITCDKVINDPQPAATNHKTWEAGHSYSVRELLESLALYGDKTAYALLDKNREITGYSKMCTDLGLPALAAGDANTPITTQEYGKLFWVLANGTYLSTEMSEYACTLLGNDDRGEGMLKTLPGSMKIAHTSSIVDLGEKGSQLKESAIIYLQGNPYLVTIMTTGKNKSDLQSVNSQLSAMVYHHMQGRN